MGMIFGQDKASGSILQRMSGMVYGGNGGMTYEGDGVTFRGDGEMIVDTGFNMMFGNKGATVQKAGNMYYGDNMKHAGQRNVTYQHAGNMLYCSDGRSWSGIESEADVRAVIQNDM